LQAPYNSIERSGRKIDIFAAFSTHQINIWRSFDEMRRCGAAHPLHVAAPLAATALPKEFAQLAIQYTPLMQMVQSFY
jgi:hypothetical protein